MKHLIAFLLFSGICLAQTGVRFGDSVPTQTTTTVPGVSSSVVVAIPGATVNFCSAPANSVPCTNKATTFTDATLATPCPTSAQIVLAGTNNCVATTDARGNWGVWVTTGAYEYTITVNGASSGPFPATPGGTGAGGVICPLGSIAIPWFNGTANLCDPALTNDGAGHFGVASLAATSVTATTVATTGPGYVKTFQTQTAPANPATGFMEWYGDSGTNKWTCLNSDGSSCAPGGAAFSGITAATNANAGTFAATGNTWDFTGSTLFKLRVTPACTTTVVGDLCYDSTSKMWHIWMNGADNFIVTAPVSGSYTDQDCVKLVKAGALFNLADSGGACGGSGSASPLAFGSATALSPTATEFFSVNGVATSEAGSQWPVPRAGTVSNLQCRSSNLFSSAQTETYTVRKGAASLVGLITSADTTLLCVENSTNTGGCLDGTHSFAVAAGDVLNIKAVPGNSPSPGVVSCSAQLQ